MGGGSYFWLFKISGEWWGKFASHIRIRRYSKTPLLIWKLLPSLVVRSTSRAEGEGMGGGTCASRIRIRRYSKEESFYPHCCLHQLALVKYINKDGAYICKPLRKIVSFKPKLPGICQWVVPFWVYMWILCRRKKNISKWMGSIGLGNWPPTPPLSQH